MYLFPALTCEPVIGALKAFTKGILWVLEAVLTEPETEINTGKLAPEASAVCLTSKTITPSLGNLHHTLGQIPNTTFSVDSPIAIVFTLGITRSKIFTVLFLPNGLNMLVLQNQSLFLLGFHDRSHFHPIRPTSRRAR